MLFESMLFHMAYPLPNTDCLHRLSPPGNAAPETSASRLLVYCFGWVMIIAFGGVMVLNGFALTTLADDICMRMNISWLRRPVYAVPLWALGNIGYMAFIAKLARTYWDNYAPNMVYTVADSYWFSYITIMTVGLGDFYIEPHGLFPIDVVIWGYTILHGMGFFTAFLERLTELIKSCIPERKERLEYHFARISVTGKDIVTPISRSLQVLRELVAERDHIHSREDDSNKFQRNFAGRDDNAKTPDGNTINLHKIDILTEKKTILLRLLKDNQSELESRMGRLTTNERMSVYTSNRVAAYKSAKPNNNSLSTRAISRFQPGSNRKSLLIPTIESLERDEEDLCRILRQTQELRRHLGDATNENDRLDGIAEEDPHNDVKEITFSVSAECVA